MIGAWLWMTAEDYELSEQKEEWVVPDRFKGIKPISVEEEEKPKEKTRTKKASKV